MKPATFLRRGPLIDLLTRHGFAKKCVQKWLREGSLPPHEFPGLPKKAGQRAYYSLETVEQRLGVALRHSTSNSH